MTIELIFTQTLPSLWAAAVGYYVVHSLVGLYLLWLFYLAVMNLQRAKENGTLSLPAKILGLPIVIVGVLLDVVVNIFVMTILFLERPKEWLVTDRLQRHVRYHSGTWRAKLAYVICHYLLDTFDPSGKHC